MPAYKDKNKGTWYVSFHYFDWTGKNVRKMKRGFATKKEAQEWEESFLRTKAASMDMTLAEFYTVYEKDVRPKLKENTWWSKEHIIRTKLIPYFGSRKMVDITVRDIIKWQNEMREYRDPAGKPYSPTYLKTVQAQLSCLFNHAVRFYELPSNPVHKAGALGSEDSEEMLFWTKEEYLQFIPTMANKPYSYYAFELLYWCGIRMGELRALTAEDFDFEKNIVSITKSYQKIKGRDVITKPKTKKSTRKVYMPEQVAREMEDFISSIYGLQPDERLFPMQLNNGYDILCSKDSRIKNVPESFGESYRWNALLKDMGANDFSYVVELEFGPNANLLNCVKQYPTYTDEKMWLYYIALCVLGAKKNSYLSLAMVNSANYRDFAKSLFRSILTVDKGDEDFQKLYVERKEILKFYSKYLNEIMDYCKVVSTKQEDAIYYLTDLTKPEKEKTIEWLDTYGHNYSAEQLEEILRNVYPDLPIIEITKKAGSSLGCVV